MSLSDAANWAQIISLAGLPLSIILWLFTKEHFAKFWKKCRTVIFSICAIFAIWAFYRYGWLNWLSHSVTWPVWALILLGLVIPAMTLAVLWLIALLQDKGVAPIHWKNYTSDLIYDVEWQWNYVRNTIDLIGSFCPRKSCMGRLEPRNEYDSRSVTAFYDKPSVSLNCDNCGYKRNFSESFDQLNRKVVLEIDRRIRTGQYKQRLAEGQD